MKKLQKGFVIPLVIAVIALLAIGGGAYVYVNKNKPSEIKLADENIKINEEENKTERIDSPAGPNRTSGWHYLKENNKVYYIFEAFDGGSIKSLVEVADAHTFVPISNGYFKDKDHVYYDGQVLLGADSNTFISKNISGKLFGLDNKSVFLGIQLLKDIDPNKVKVERGKGMGEVISDDETNLYLKGNCDGGNWFIEEKEFFGKYLKGWTKQKYLNDYTFC
jgi:hypothetical protein